MDADRTAPACRICDAAQLGEPVAVREMMFGTRESFDYVRCGACGTFQIARIPDDLGRFYGGSSYYSFNNRFQRPLPERVLTRIAAAAMIGRPARYPRGRSILARIGARAEPWIANIEGLRFASAILDVGCGEGARLEHLAQLGFSNLAGIDPFLPPEKAGRAASGIRLQKGELSEAQGRYDLITMHHSLEHFADPGSMLRTAAGLLAPGGRIYVSIPLFQDVIWQRYGPHWSQIDAPRHLYLFTTQAFIALAERSGLRCRANGYNGLGWSLAWSEAYAEGLPMHAPDGRPNPLDADRLEAAEREAEALNARGESDQGWFVLEPA